MKTICLYCFDGVDNYRRHVRECPERTHDIQVINSSGETVRIIPAPKKKDQP